MNLPALRGGIDWIYRKPGNQFRLSVTLGSNKEQQDYRYDLTVLVNGAKAEVHAEKLVLLSYGSRRESPGEKILFQTKEEESRHWFVKVGELQSPLN